MENNRFNISELLDLNKTIAARLFEGHRYPWEVLPLIKEFALSLGKLLPAEEYDNPREDIWISKKANIFESAYIAGPCVICGGAEVRHCAFIRGGVIIGKNAVVGNSTELKNAILFDNVQVPHYNYVGDSVLGYKSHMGAGAITSNVKSDKTHVLIKDGGSVLDTGLKKVGAIVGDGAEIGCGSVLNPGTVIGRESNIYPLSSVRGYVPPKSIYKCRGEIVKKYEQ